MEDWVLGEGFGLGMCVCVVVVCSDSKVVGFDEVV